MATSIDHPALVPLKAKFPDAGLRAGEFRGQVTLAVARETLLAVTTFLRDEPSLKFDMLADLHGVDYLNYPGAPHRFAVNYNLTSVDRNLRLWLKVFLDPARETGPGQNSPRDEDILEQGDPGLKVDSVYPVWPSADWMEREAYDLFGIIFVGHPDLRRILTWNGYGAYPLRKDYPLRGIGERENYKIVSREGA